MPVSKNNASHLQKIEALERENESLRAELRESQDVLQAIREGQVDALIVSGADGDRIFTLRGAEHPYRVLIEQMQEGAATVVLDGRIYYANAAFAKMLDRPLEEVIGSRFHDHLAPHNLPGFEVLLNQAASGSARAEFQLINRTGSSLPVYLGLTPVVTEAGASVCMVVADLSEQKRVEQILASEQQARAILNQAADAIVVCDAEGRLVFVNGAAELFALKQACSGQFVLTNELWGRILDVDGRDIPPSEWPQARALRGIAGSNQEVSLLHADGKRCNLLLSAAPLRDQKGGIIGAVTTFKDITKWKQTEAALRESEERLRSLAENVPCVLMRFDRQFRILYLSPQSDRYNPNPVEQMIGRTNREAGMPAELCDRWEAATERVFRTGCEEELEFDLAGPSGMRTFTLKLAPEFGPGDEVQSVLGVSSDITERKFAEEALKDADRKKDEFLAMLAHELRNPMAAISSATALLSLPNVNQEQSAYAKDVLKNRVKQLSRMVDDMLDVSRIIRGKTELHKQEFDLCLAVQGAVEATKTFFDEGKHALILKVSGPLPIYGDPVRLEQVLNNLLTNAARYTRDGGKITLTAAAEEGNALISVKDDGIGMSAALLPRIFDLFGQGEGSLHRTSGGLGIGLTLVKKLVELHGGSVSAASEGEGKGSEFVVRLPLARERVKPAETDEKRSNLPGLAILLAEDNRDTALLTAELLEQENHRVDVAFDGPSALELAFSKQYDVFLVDLGLPGMNGFDVAAKVRKQETTNRTLIIAVSGYGQDRDLERAKESGIDYHLLKPVDYGKLTKLLQERQGVETGRETALVW